ncbi:hypothetical protein MA16_Dca015923 [Dendrobium catenatum]|uniref:Uncharacterized protein n=1 Tax=Dendrobium catenatum TaxID=906689 RepID=A0A2I0VP94_9ASPA|nr:hypothetical protein MA16_Dca015923 [Dendrobium catenatum]
MNLDAYKWLAFFAKSTKPDSFGFLRAGSHLFVKSMKESLKLRRDSAMVHLCSLKFPEIFSFLICDVDVRYLS